MNTKARLSKLEKLNTGTDWEKIHERMNQFFEGSGIGLRYENGELVQRPELSRPAPNRDLNNF